MQQLSEFPKANNVFKQYVNSHIENLIGQSQSLANKYMKEKEDLIKKQRQAETNSIKQIKKKIKLLQILINTPFQFRQDIEDVRGLSTEDIKAIKTEYEKIIEKYNIQQIDLDNSLGNVREKIYQNNLDQSFGSKDEQKTFRQNELISNKSFQKNVILKYLLQILQASTIVIVVSAICWRIVM